MRVPCLPPCRLTGGTRGVHFPRDGIADTDDSAVEHLRKDATAPFWLQGSAQSGCRLIHSLAWCQLTADLDAAGTNQQDATAGVRQLDPADQDVRATRCRSGIAAERRGCRVPCLARQDG